MVTTVGIVGVQGDVPEHAAAMADAISGDVAVEAVRTAGIVPDCDVIAIPGGESTTISRIIRETGIDQEIIDHAEADKPILATCAGLIICAGTVTDDRITSLDLLDVTIERNAYGRQRESFEASIAVDGLDEPYPGIFIRAPRIDNAGTTDVLARLDDTPVAVRQGSVVGASFHPELTGDYRFHQLVLAGDQ